MAKHQPQATQSASLLICRLYCYHCAPQPTEQDPFSAVIAAATVTAAGLFLRAVALDICAAFWAKNYFSGAFNSSPVYVERPGDDNCYSTLPRTREIVSMQLRPQSRMVT